MYPLIRINFMCTYYTYRTTEWMHTTNIHSMYIGTENTTREYITHNFMWIGEIK